MPTAKLKKILKHHKIEHTVIPHHHAYTAQGVAEAAHISGKEVAKIVIVKLDGKMVMLVLPASYRVDVEHLKAVTGAQHVQLADELEFRDVFSDCETGAMPPFGNFYGMDVYVSKRLTEDEKIAFNAGNHSELIQMKYADFERLVNPKVIDFTLELV